MKPAALTPNDVRGRAIGPRGQVRLRAAPRRGRPGAATPATPRRPTRPVAGRSRAVLVVGRGEHMATWVLAPVAVPLTANGSHGHWRKSATVRRRLRASVALACRALDPCPGAPGWLVVLTRVAPRRADDDNVVAALKVVRDAVAERLGVDDGDPRVRWAVRQATGSPGLRIDVRPVVAAQRTAVDVRDGVRLWCVDRAVLKTSPEHVAVLLGETTAHDNRGGDLGRALALLAALVGVAEEA